MWVTFSYLTIVLLSILIFQALGLKFIGKRANPFGMFFSINIFLISLPGMLIVYSKQYETLLNVGIFSVPDTVIDYVAISYFYSLVVIFLLLISVCIIFKGFTVPQVAAYSIHDALIHKSTMYKFINIAIVLNLFFLVCLFFKVGLNRLPLFALINGDIFYAQILKAQLITGDIAKLPESVNQIFRILVPLTAYMSLHLRLISNAKKSYRWQLYISVFLAFLFYTYDIQKAPFFTFSFGIIFLYMFHRGASFKLFIFFPILFVLLLGVNLLYFNIEFDDAGIGFEKVMTRLIIMQNQGMFYIVDNISPSYEYLKNGMILSSYVFDKIPVSADAKVMEMLYGYSEANVNMNTYFLGQAYSIGGTLGILISPLIIGSHLVLYLVFFKIVYLKNIDFFLPLSIVFYLFFIPINQGFNTFFYARNVIFFVIFSGLIYGLFLSVRALTKKRFNENYNRVI